MAPPIGRFIGRGSNIFAFTRQHRTVNSIYGRLGIKANESHVKGELNEMLQQFFCKILKTEAANIQGCLRFGSFKGDLKHSEFP